MLLKLNFILSSGLLLVALAKTESHSSEKYPNFDPKNDFPVKWPMIEKAYRRAANSLLGGNISKLYKLSQKLNISSSCQDSLFKWVIASRTFEEWAVRMVDASGKIPSGILDGTVMDLGSYDECLKVRVGESAGDELFRGRYCLVGYKSPLLAPFSQKTPTGQDYVDAFGYPPGWISDYIIQTGPYLKRVAIWFGTCVPSTCSEDDVWHISTFVSKPFGFNVLMSGCQMDEPFSWATSALVAVYTLSFLAGCCIMGTIFDICQRYSSENFLRSNLNCKLQFVTAFSVVKNTEKLLQVKSGNQTLGCFHGIRFFTATWIILGHTYFFTDTWKYLRYRNLLGIDQMFNGSLPPAVIENFTVPVSSFFFMSGFLLVYATWKKLEKFEGRLNVLIFFIHKYWRMTPALVLMILMLLCLPIIHSGPLWNSTLNPPIQACENYWWRNILYINNLWDSDKYCLIHTWYLAALMQFHIVGVLLLILSFRWPLAGILLGSTIAVVSCTMTALVTIWNNFPMPAPGFNKDIDTFLDYGSKIYSKPFCHITTYLIGMAVAHLVLAYKDTRLRLRYQVLGWILASGGALSAVYGLYGPADSLIIRSFYISCHRIGWSAAIGWLTFACTTGVGGIVNRILSWKVFVPLGHLSYLVYLIHPLVMLYKTASLRERDYYGHTELVFEFLAYIVISFFIAFIGYITVEMPFSNLESLVFKSKSQISTTNLCDTKESPGMICDVRIDR